MKLLKCKNNTKVESKSFISCALSELKENTKKIILSFFNIKPRKQYLLYTIPVIIKWGYLC